MNGNDNSLVIEELAFAYPDMFAALVPIAGFVDRVPMIENCKIKIESRIFFIVQGI